MNTQENFIVDGTVFAREAVGGDTFIVHSSPRSYAVHWNDDADPISKLNEILAANEKNVLFIDKNVLSLYGSSINIAPDRIFAATATEEFKTMDGVNQLIDFLCQRQFTKSETLVVVGGGITQDVGGFVAACYKRGIRWVFFPTTLLAMCDSCIGAKTGVNYQKAKNQIGFFSAPNEVIINANFLKTLAQNDILSGLGEVLKLCITGGSTLLALYREKVQAGQVIDWIDYKPLILSVLSVKKAIIEADEFEVNLRKGLNYGHTLGHVIEVLSDYRIPHGTAVVIGMMLINELSCNHGYLSVDDKIFLNQLCEELIHDDIIDVMSQISVDKLMCLLNNDKKVEGSDIRFVVAKKAGELCFLKLKLNDVLTAEIMSYLAFFTPLKLRK